MKRNKLAIALCLMLMLSLLMSTAYAATSDEPISPLRYSNITSFSVDFDITSSGLSSDYSKVHLSNSKDTVNLTIELQQYSGGSWSTIKSWSTSGSGTVSLDKTWYVSSGYSYRLYATANVYTSSGTLAETETLTSYTVKY